MGQKRESLLVLVLILAVVGMGLYLGHEAVLKKLEGAYADSIQKQGELSKKNQEELKEKQQEIEQLKADKTKLENEKTKLSQELDSQKQTLADLIKQSQHSLVLEEQVKLLSENCVIKPKPAPVVVVNTPPTVNAGADREITLPQNSLGLNATAKDKNGVITGYQWTKVSGPNQGTLSNTKTPNLKLNDLVAGTYTLNLKVTDNNGSTAQDTVKVTVHPEPVVNTPPTVNAGADREITLPVNSLNLSAAAKDNDGVITRYQWGKSSGPDQGTLSEINTPNLKLTDLAVGEYYFNIKVTDNSGSTAQDFVKVTVKPAPVVVEKVMAKESAKSSEATTIIINKVYVQDKNKGETRLIKEDRKVLKGDAYPNDLLK